VSLTQQLLGHSTSAVVAPDARMGAALHLLRRGRGGDSRQGREAAAAGASKEVRCAHSDGGCPSIAQPLVRDGRRSTRFAPERQQPRA
jgi:hypothetical protein